MTTQGDQAAAILAAINAQFATGKRAYDQDDKALATITTDHIIVFVSRRYVADRLASGEVTIPGGRVVTRYVGTSMIGARILRDKTAAALEDKILPGGIGPFTFETDDTIEQDDSWWSGADSWTF